MVRGTGGGGQSLLPKATGDVRRDSVVALWLGRCRQNLEGPYWTIDFLGEECIQGGRSKGTKQEVEKQTQKPGEGVEEKRTGLDCELSSIFASFCTGPVLRTELCNHSRPT